MSLINASLTNLADYDTQDLTTPKQLPLKFSVLQNQDKLRLKYWYLVTFEFQRFSRQVLSKPYYTRFGKDLAGKRNHYLKYHQKSSYGFVYSIYLCQSFSDPIQGRGMLWVLVGRKFATSIFGRNWYFSTRKLFILVRVSVMLTSIKTLLRSYILYQTICNQLFLENDLFK